VKNGTDPISTLFFMLIVIFIIFIYILPSYIAFKNRHPNRWVIFVINIALGGTFIGWLIAMVWANKAVHISSTAGTSPGGESGLNVFINDEKKVRLVKDETNFGSVADKGNATKLNQINYLEKIYSLREKGILTEEEYLKLKHDILNGPE
jgi:hypothetical protein